MLESEEKTEINFLMKEVKSSQVFSLIFNSLLQIGEWHCAKKWVC